MQEEGVITAADRTTPETLSNWEKHKHLLKAMSLKQEESASVGNGPINANEENVSVRELFKLWAAGQFSSLSECESENSKSIPISKETLMEFLLPKMTWYRNTVQQLSSEVDMRKPSEVLYFLISLQNSGDLHEKYAGELPKSVSTSFSGFFLFDQKLLQTKESKILKEIPLSFKIGQHQVISMLPESGFSKGNDFPSLASLPWLKESAADVLRRKCTH